MDDYGGTYPHGQRIISDLSSGISHPGLILE